jgi:hypothetical protein
MGWIPLTGSGGGGGPVNGAYSETIGDNTNTTFTVTHDLGTTDLVVQLWDLTGADPVEATADATTIEATSVNAIDVTFSAAPAVDSYRVVVLSDGGNIGPSWMSHLVAPLDTPLYAQEFGGSSGYTLVEPSGTTAVIEDRSVLSVRYHSQTTGHSTAFLWEIQAGDSFAVADYLETAFQTVGITGAENSIAGVVLTDGTGTTANQVALWVIYAGSALPILDLRGGTLDAHGATLGQRTINNASQMPLMRLKLTRTASTSWQGEVSADGLQWTAFGASAVSRTITPTHWGVVVTRSGSGTEESITGFDYLRWYRP